MSIPFFFEPYDFKMSKSFLNGSNSKNDGLIYEKFLNQSLKNLLNIKDNNNTID